MFSDYFPNSVNSGPWITAYTLPELQAMTDAEYVLPICSMATPYDVCAELGPLVLPPLFQEAMDGDLKRLMVNRIRQCFPRYTGADSDRLRVIEIPPADLPPATPARLVAFSVDTAVEEHGPHLPLATDTIQSYSVLHELTQEFESIELARPLDYGQLTWGLPFGFSIDLTAGLLREYVRRYVDALVRWKNPESIYVVDVHGSITHRGAIVDGLKDSGFSRWAFRWLHEPLAEFASQRGDQHAGGVETALVERVGADLLDSRWWPDRMDEIAAGQMSFRDAVELTDDLDAFIDHVRQRCLNGIIGDIQNYHRLDADELFRRMISVARDDVKRLLEGEGTQSAGEKFW